MVEVNTLDLLLTLKEEEVVQQLVGLVQDLVLAEDQEGQEQQLLLLELLQLTLVVEVQLLVLVQEEQVVEEQEILFLDQHPREMEQITLAAVEVDKDIVRHQELVVQA